MHSIGNVIKIERVCFLVMPSLYSLEGSSMCSRNTYCEGEENDGE